MQVSYNLGSRSNSSFLVKMGKRKDLLEEEKAKIIRLLGQGESTLGISRILKRDHRTIKSFVESGNKCRKKRSDAGRRCVTPRDMNALKRQMCKMPLATSASIFKAAGVAPKSRATRFRVLTMIGSVKKAQRRPPLNGKHKAKRMAWARKYLKLDFKRVLWTDEMRCTLDGPDGWSRGWICNERSTPFRLKRQQGGGGIMTWAGIIDGELVGPFRVEDGVKIDSASYCGFLSHTLLPWYRKQRAAKKKNMMLMQDNAPSHASKYSKTWLSKNGFRDDKIMDWPPCSPDINPIENLWSIIKWKVYADGNQYSSKEALWHAIEVAAKSLTKAELQKLTDSMDNRLFSIIEKNGGYIKY